MATQVQKRDDAPHWYWFSINHRKHPDALRRLWLHRSWHVYYHSREMLSVELSMPGTFAWRIVLNDEEPIAGRLGLGLFTFYWSLGSFWLTRPLSKWMTSRYRYEAREIEVYWNREAHALFWSLWMRTHEWRRRDAKWRRGSFHPLDVLFGRTQFQGEQLGVQNAVEFHIPGDPWPYYADATLERHTWTRPRWPWRPFTLTRRAVDLDLHAPIPIPGKGENSWDCDDDAIYSTNVTAATVEEAIAKLVDDVQKTRIRYGGQRWQPSARSASPNDTENHEEGATHDD